MSNPNDCLSCSGWGCTKCTPKGLGEQADPDFDELVHLQAEVKRLRSTSQELEIDRLRAESAEWQRKYEVTEKLKEQLANVPAGGPSRELVIITLAGVIQQRDGAIAEAAAFKRERDIARAGLDPKAIAYIRDAAKSEERAAIVALIQNEGEKRFGCWDPALIAAIDARGQE